VAKIPNKKVTLYIPLAGASPCIAIGNGSQVCIPGKSLSEYWFAVCLSLQDQEKISGTN